MRPGNAVNDARNPEHKQTHPCTGSVRDGKDSMNRWMSRLKSTENRLTRDGPGNLVSLTANFIPSL